MLDNAGNGVRTVTPEPEQILCRIAKGHVPEVDDPIQRRPFEVDQQMFAD